MTVKLLTEHDLEILSLKGDFTGSSESTLVKIPHCWKLRVTAHMYYVVFIEKHSIQHLHLIYFGSHWPSDSIAINGYAF